jgi:hypothetical protein
VESTPAGFLPVEVIIPITMAFVVRVVVLVAVTLTDAGGPTSPAGASTVAATP